MQLQYAPAIFTSICSFWASMSEPQISCSQAMSILRTAHCKSDIMYEAICFQLSVWNMQLWCAYETVGIHAQCSWDLYTIAKGAFNLLSLWLMVHGTRNTLMWNLHWNKVKLRCSSMPEWTSRERISAANISACIWLWIVPQVWADGVRMWFPWYEG